MRLWSRHSKPLFCVLTTLICANAFAAPENSFAAFMQTLTATAINRGVDAEVAQRVANQTKLFRRARLTPRHYSSLEQYIPTMVTSAKVDAGLQLFGRHQAQFLKLSRQYGVQPRFILAQWSMLSPDMTFTDDTRLYPLVSVVASQAYRGDVHAVNAYVAALKLIAGGRYRVDSLLAASDGTIGPLGMSAQMLLTCAVDGDGDGNVDIWHNVLDNYASAANCLQVAGWDTSQTWGRQVRAPASLLNQTGLDIRLPFAAWEQQGVRRYDGRHLPKRHDMQVSLLMPDGVTGRKYIVYKNYRALYQQHADHYLVLAIAHLSERMKALGMD